MVRFPNSSEGPPRRPVPLSKAAAVVGGGLLLIVAIGFYYWFIARVEVGADELLILVNKTGRTLPPEFTEEFGDQVVLYPALVTKLAAHHGKPEEWVRTHYKGIQYEVRLAGRYFFHPYYHKRLKEKEQKATLINQNEVGVLIRKYGKPLPFPKTAAPTPPYHSSLRPG